MDARDVAESIPLHTACRKGNLDKGADVDTREFYTESPQVSETTKLLVQADINARDKFDTPLCCACELDDLVIVNFLLDEGENVNVSRCRTTPLHIACKKGSLDIIKLLLGYQANPHLKSMRGKTPLDILNAHPRINDEDKQNLIRRIEGKELSLVALCESVIIKELRENIKKGRSHSISSGLEALDLPTYTAAQLFPGIFPKPKSALTDPSTENGLSNSVAP